LSGELVRLVILQRNWYFSVNPAAGVPEPIPASLFTGSECQYPPKQTKVSSQGISSEIPDADVSSNRCLHRIKQMFEQDETFLQGAVEAVKELALIATSGLSVRQSLTSSFTEYFVP
jgi:hypothetical protein